MQVNRKLQENDPKQAIDNDGGVSSCDEDESNEGDKRKNKRVNNRVAEELPNLKIVKMEEQIQSTLSDIINLKTGQILDE